MNGRSSRNRIRGSNTKPKMPVRRFLFAQGFRYRLHMKDLPGIPDIVLPKTRTEWWFQKIKSTMRTDKETEKIKW